VFGGRRAGGAPRSNLAYPHTRQILDVPSLQAPETPEEFPEPEGIE